MGQGSTSLLIFGLVHMCGAKVAATCRGLNHAFGWFCSEADSI